MKDTDKNKYPVKNIVLFTLNASYLHTSLALRCLADAIIEYKKLDCRAVYTGEKTCSAPDPSANSSPADIHEAKEKYDVFPITLKIIERTISDSSNRVLSELYQSCGDIFLFSCYIWNIESMMHQALDLKKLLPDSVIIAGGTEISYRGSDFFETHPYIDCIIRGDGEISVPETVESIIRTGRAERDIDGIHYDRFENDKTHYERFPPHSGSMVYYETSRGCPYRCGYCVSGIKRSGNLQIEAKNVGNSLAGLYEFEKYPDVKIVKLVDRTFNFDRGRANEIWRELSGCKYTKKYHFEVCADLIDDTALDILKNVPDGKFQFEIGIQSTNRETLSACGRASSVEKTICQMEKLYKLGNIKIHADLIAGLPCESYSRFAQSFNSVYGKCDEIQIGFLKLLYGTALREKAESFGCVFSDNPPYTVLKTDCIDYSEIELLRNIADVLARFAESGRFKETMNFLLEKASSPFSFFEKFTKYIKENNPAGVRGLSQRCAYEELYCFGLNLLVSENDRDELFEKISLDFENNEVGRLPLKIRSFKRGEIQA